MTHESKVTAGEVYSPPPRSVFDLECCPECSGKSGFTYIMTMRGTQFQPWKGGKLDAYFEASRTYHGAYRCDECGKIIKPNKKDQIHEPR